MEMKKDDKIRVSAGHYRLADDSSDDDGETSNNTADIKTLDWLTYTKFTSGLLTLIATNISLAHIDRLAMLSLSNIKTLILSHNSLDDTNLAILFQLRTLSSTRNFN